MSSRLVVVPARFGSKGIPRKVIRTLGGKPLISHCLRTVCSDVVDADIVVSTDDPEVGDLCRALFPKVTLMDRSAELCGDKATLDEVVLECVRRLVDQGRTYQSVITVQPTSPFVTEPSIAEAFRVLEGGDVDTVLSVKRECKLKWQIKDGLPQPLYRARVNRQFIEPEFVETGAVIGSTVENLLRAGTRIGKSVHLVELSGQEALDIDTSLDWVEAEAALAQRRIAIVTVGSVANGMGHVYRVATIAADLAAHHIRFYCKEGEDLAIGYLRERNYPVLVHRDDDELMTQLREFAPDAIVNDCLDTDRTFVGKQKEISERVICFEDLGSGARLADAVVNELYPPAFDGERVYSGPAYACLRDEFFWVPHRPRTERDGLLVTFGGADESNLTLKCLKWMASDARFGRIPKTVVLGRGYRHWSELEAWLEASGISGVEIIKDTRRMSELMSKARVGICSGGRTVYEYFACETPTVVICQNVRELTHLFLKDVNGVRNFGLYSESFKDDFLDSVISLHDNDLMAQEAVANMDSERIRTGRRRIRQLILSGEKAPLLKGAK